ncbi:MAG: hypothetical protein Hyperionvirus2_105 [Hyperionvirus sp.]|uniref:Uncharacterized protein n=1 Tax=Hyperionvirus sp. TaxID=2487770 RepID=A0A3G5A679_9VIRU|nr:MAG: hypothetical protein Hyperionvirus2_105 [Hyperionvirus sp.]
MEIALTSSVQKYLDSPHKTFKIFNITYTSRMSNCLKDFNIAAHTSYDFWGFVEDSTKDLSAFLQTLGNNEIESVNILEKIINRIINKVSRAYKKDCVWVSLRVTLPASSYEPRWHIDGNFYKSDQKFQSKFVTVLKGPGTLFAELDEQTRAEFFNTAHIVPWNYDQQQLYQNKIIADAPNIKFTQLTNNQGAIFIVGNLTLSAIHSEPPFNEPRIFLSILPADKSEIEQLTARWKAEFGQTSIK